MPGVTPADVLSNFGITLVEDPAENQPRLLVDLPAAELVEHAIRREEGRMASNGALVIETGSVPAVPHDRFIVDTPMSTTNCLGRRQPPAVRREL